MTKDISEELQKKEMTAGEACDSLIAGMQKFVDSQVKQYAHKVYGKNVPDNLSVSVHTIDGVPRMASDKGQLVLVFTYTVEAVQSGFGISVQGIGQPVFLLNGKERKNAQTSFLSMLKKMKEEPSSQ